jgi:hypothetical protein
MKCSISSSTGIFGKRSVLGALCFLTTFGWLAVGLPTQALAVSQERDIVNLRLGQRIRVDDGTCPAGQVKEVSGTKMTETGVARSRKCVPRVGPKLK